MLQCGHLAFSGSKRTSRMPRSASRGTSPSAHRASMPRDAAREQSDESRETRILPVSMAVRSNTSSGTPPMYAASNPSSLSFLARSPSMPSRRSLGRATPAPAPPAPTCTPRRGTSRPPLLGSRTTFRTDRRILRRISCA